MDAPYNWEDNVKDFPRYEKNAQWQAGFRAGWDAKEQVLQREKEEANVQHEQSV